MNLDWRKFHRRMAAVLVAALVMVAAGLGLTPLQGNATVLGMFLGSLAMFPHFAFGTRIWHDKRRSGIGIPIALIAIRYLVTLILFSVILWQFPAERRIIGWTVGIWVIVLTSIEAFLFAKGVGRL